MTDNSETPPAHLSGNGRPVVEETFNNKLKENGQKYMVFGKNDW